jgi:hypothetical protein
LTVLRSSLAEMVSPAAVSGVIVHRELAVNDAVQRLRF